MGASSMRACTIRAVETCSTVQSVKEASPADRGFNYRLRRTIMDMVAEA